MSFMSLLLQLIKFVLLPFCMMALMNAHGYEADYQIRVNQALDHFAVKACFADRVPEALVNGALNDNRWLHSATDADGRALRVRGNRMDLGDIKPGQCVDYQVKLPAHKVRRRHYYRSGGDMMVNNDRWLWQPENVGSRDRVTLHFELPADHRISTPWPLAGVAPRHAFTLTDTPYGWDSRIAIGRFSIEPVKVAGQTLQIAVLNSHGKRRQAYIGWITEAARAIAGLNGEFPVDNAQILIVPTGARHEAVPWGEVQRGGAFFC